jgi:predicted anti-sigma-YlaC factor YlaD
MKEHLTRGTLQALLDGELSEEHRAAVAGHLSACDRCRAIRASLERDSALFSSAVALVDTPPSRSAADADRELAGVVSIDDRRPDRAVTGAGRVSRWSRAAIVRAAILIIGFAGVAAAVVPGSPLGTWVREVGRQLVGEPAALPLEPSVDVDMGDAAAISLLPSDGALRVVITGFSAESTVRVRIVEGTQGYVRVRETAEDPRFVTAPGRIEVTGQGDGEIWIDLPKSAVEASVEVDGQSIILKEGDQLRMVQPATDSLFGDILFRVGS